MNNLTREHKALLYIIANVDGLRSKKNKIYNEEKNQLNLDFKDDCTGFDLSELFLSGSETRMLKAGINLFNGNEHIDIRDCFLGLDPFNQKIMLDAIKIRFEI